MSDSGDSSVWPSSARPPASELASDVAHTLDTEPGLLPCLPYLLQDLEDLGAVAAEVVALLAGVELPAERSVLELGCGKGAVALELAARFGREVQGVDAMPAFIEHARRRAAALGLEDRCRFEVGDLREWIDRERGHGMACLLATVRIGADLADTVVALRRCVVPGGLMLIDDAYLSDEVRPGELANYVDCAHHGETLARLERHGDRVLAERCVDGPEAAGYYDEMFRRIHRRAGELALREPRMAAAIQEYVERQERECALLAGPVIGALWVLRRGD